MNRDGRTSSFAGALTVGSLLRSVGRVAIWTVLALLLLRGLLAGTSGGAGGTSPTSGPQVAPRSAAFAIGFARTYLNDPTQRALDPLLVNGADLGRGRGPVEDLVAQAEVSDIEELGGGRAVFTVACELRDARTLYLAVPIARSEADEVAALGAPSLVAGPGPAGVAPERLQPVAGRDSAAIQALVEKFLPAYVTAGEAGDLAYLVAPGSEVQPLGGGLALASISEIRQLGSGEGNRREVHAAAVLTDPATGASYPVVYRLALTRSARWYVRGIEGAMA